MTLVDWNRCTRLIERSDAKTFGANRADGNPRREAGSKVMICDGDTGPASTAQRCRTRCACQCEGPKHQQYAGLYCRDPKARERPMSRRATNEAVQPPPAAPPLPPSRYASRAANVLARFAQPFFQGSRPSSPDGDTRRQSRALGVRPLSAESTASSSASVVHRTGIPIAALDISPDRSHVILAGREILKTVRVTSETCNEVLNLRSAITSYASTQTTAEERGGVKHKSQLIANDVKWSHSNFSSVIATAAPNGQIVLYDLEKAFVQVACLHEHPRQVHRLAFNPHHAPLLLSGSQDGTIRLWDLRTGHRNGAVGRFDSKAVFAGSSDGVRDVRWSPTKGVEFIACTDSGLIQQWDILQTAKPILRVKAHAKACRAIDWHPDGKHVVSGGADKVINVWDLSTRNFRMKPYMQIRTPQPVMNTRWRPPCQKGRDQAENWQTTQLAVSYDGQEPKIQIWDFRRPYIPFREIAHYDTPAADMLWHSEDRLWSVDHAGIFTQTDVKQARNPFQIKSRNGVAVSPTGQICLFSEGRPQSHFSFIDDYDEFQQWIPPLAEKTMRSSESPSVNEGSFEDPNASLSVRFRQRRTPKNLAHRSTDSSLVVSGSGQPILRFDESVPRNLPIRVLQATAYGGVEGVARSELFRFFAEGYHTIGGNSSADRDERMSDHVAEAFESNGDLAMSMGDHRLGQSWCILALALRKEFTMESRIQKQVPLPEELWTPMKRPEAIPRSTDPDGKEIDRLEPLQSKAIPPPRSDYGSNAATPIARPVSDLTIQLEQHRARTYENDMTKFALPAPKSKVLESLVHRQVSPTHSGMPHHQIDQSSYEDNALISASHSSGSDLATDSVNIDEHWGDRRAAANENQPKPRPVLRFDQRANTDGQNGILPSFVRHASDESDPMFSASIDHSLRSASFASSFNSNVVTGSPLKTVHDVEDDNKRLQDGALTVISGTWSGSQRSKTLVPTIKTDINASTWQEPRALIRPSAHQPPIVHMDEIKGSEGSKQLPELHSPDATAKSYLEQPQPQVPSVDPRPWSATAMLRPLLEYHTRSLSDSQLPAHLITSLVPLVQHDMPPALLENILLTYHDQLTSMSLFVEAAWLRNVVHSTYPEISDYGLLGVKAGGPWCTSCQKPSKGERRGFCERCRTRWDECVICEGDSALLQHHGSGDGSIEPVDYGRDGDADRPLWAWCQECGHSQHTSCLRMWWSDVEMSHGLCPVTGCLHACVAGTARDEMLRADAEGRKAGGHVRGDEWSVAESKAVQKARRMIGSGGHAGGSRIGR